MSNRYYLAYRVFDSEKSAKAFCDNENKNATPYIRKNKPAHYTSWNNPDEPNMFIAWYYTR